MFETIHPAPRDIVWSFMTDPAIRPRWQAGVDGGRRAAGRAAARRRNDQPLHAGKDVLVEEIVDWRPTDYWTLRTTLPNGFSAVSTYLYQDVPDGTKVRVAVHLGQKPTRARGGGAPIREFLDEVVNVGQAALREVLVAEMTRRATLAAETPPEPDAPGSLDREILQPIKR